MLAHHAVCMLPHILRLLSDAAQVQAERYDKGDYRPWNAVTVLFQLSVLARGAFCPDTRTTQPTKAHIKLAADLLAQLPLEYRVPLEQQLLRSLSAGNNPALRQELLAELNLPAPVPLADGQPQVPLAG